MYLQLFWISPCTLIKIKDRSIISHEISTLRLFKFFVDKCQSKISSSQYFGHGIRAKLLNKKLPLMVVI